MRLEQMNRVGRINTPFMTVYLVSFLPKVPYIHRTYMALANPTDEESVRGRGSAVAGAILGNNMRVTFCHVPSQTRAHTHTNTHTHTHTHTQHTHTHAHTHTHIHTHTLHIVLHRAHGHTCCCTYLIMQRLHSSQYYVHTQSHTKA
jgi:hypothetical protein